MKVKKKQMEFFLPVRSADDALNCLIVDKYFVFALNFTNLVNALTPTVDDTRIT